MAEPDPDPRPPLAVPPEHPHRLVYVGTPDLAVPPLRALVAHGFEVALVVTRADTRRGRGGGQQPSPVKAAALELGLPVAHTVAAALDVNAELGVVVAFGQLIRRPVLERLPMVNLHFSLLPRWRGAAPVERAVLAGDTETGVCLMQLDEGLDTGPVYACERVELSPATTAAQLRSQLVELGTALLVRELRAGLRDPRPQVGEPTYAAKLDPAELRIDWSAPAEAVVRLIRLGRAWTTFRGHRLRVLDADVAVDVAAAGEPGTLAGEVVACGTGAVVLREVQPEGKRPVPVAAWRHGARPAPGERLGP